MRVIVTIARILTGALFIFSGLVKAIDPRGLAYKMQEFFEVFAREGYFKKSMDALNEHALTFSIMIITAEVILGVAILLGWQKKLTTWLLLLLMLLFTFLTSFVLFSGKIEACGCFGDCIPITPVQTFTKDIILMVLVLILLFGSRFIRPMNKPFILSAWMILALILTLSLQFYVLKHLPPVDCLPFKKGNNILELSKIPVNAIPDKFDYTFVYEKKGIKKEFPATALPDSSWNFSERKQVLIQKGSNNVPLVNDFKLTAADGSDSTLTVFNDTKGYYLFFLEFPTLYTDKWINEFHKLSNSLSGKNKLFLVTSQRRAAENFLLKNNVTVDGIYTCDATAIKTAARSNPAVFFMKGPVIQHKWGWADIEDIVD